MSNYHINVCNKHHGHIHDSDYIGRGSPLGNPYPITVQHDRDMVIDMYEQHINQAIDRCDPKIINELNRLMDKLRTKGSLDLMCFCAPRRCHGDIIKALLLNKMKALGLMS